MKLYYFSLLTIFSTFLNANAQTGFDQKLERYIDYHAVPHEAVHLQLNKNLVVNGEPVAYAAYVKDLATNKADTLATNLYVVVEDANNNTVQRELIKLKSGHSSGLIKTEELEPGNYTVKAFTAWMKNFDNPHFYQGTFDVVEDNYRTENDEVKNVKYNIQLLAEGGHLIANRLNTVGAIIKDENGYGISVEVAVTSDNGEVTTFMTDKRGLGRFSILPKAGLIYKVSASIDDQSISTTLPATDEAGINVQLIPWTNDVIIQMNTTGGNFDTQDISALIHQGKKFIKFTPEFKNDNTTFSVDKKALPSGINTLTVFKGDAPILSRVFFNNHDFKLIEVQETIKEIGIDTLSVTLIPQQQVEELMLSVSILPAGTQSYDDSNSIIENLLLKPYVKGFVQDAGAYFGDLDRKNLYDLDNLLLTQGWRAYDWEDEPALTINYPYETGISAKVQINGKPMDGYMVLPLQNTGSSIIDSETINKDKFFTLKSIFPVKDERLQITAFNKKGNDKRPALAPIFYPREFPGFTNDSKIYSLDKKVDISSQDLSGVYFQEADSLDPVVVKAEKRLKRNELLKRRARGRMTIFDDRLRETERNLSTWLNKNGYVASEFYGELLVRNPRPVNTKNGQPLIIVDGTVYTNFGILANFDMSIVDYIEVNKNGVGYGFRGGGGVITIETDPSLSPFRDRENGITGYEFPLTFAAPDEFYKPSYLSFDTKIFERIGVIHWEPKLQFKGETAEFKFPSMYRGDMKLFLEGMDGEGNLLLQEIKISATDFE